MASSRTDVGPDPDARSRTMKHISRACVGCRRKKVKCDGARPQCANCKLQKQECSMPREMDRRKLGSKERLSRLVSYTQTLESIMLNNGIPLPGRPANTLPPLEEEQHTRRPSTSTSTLEEREFVPQPTSPPSPPSPEQNPEEESSAATITGNSDSAIDLLSDRIGSLQIAEDGQLRFFGATSNLHISHAGPMPLVNSNIRTVHGNEETILLAVGVGHCIDEELEDHFLKLYFGWEDPNIPVVDEAVYLRARHDYRRTGQTSHRYSESLTNAMCAVGSVLSDRLCQGVPEPPVEFFATRARALLEVEMDAPTLCTVQTLVIMSGVEALLIRDARGWLCSGMAMRLVIDLGLHIDVFPFVERGLIDHEEAQLRSRVFWGTFVHERLWSLYVGRPESLNEDHITVRLPDATRNSHRSQSTWKPYVEENQSLDAVPSPALLDEVAQATVSLCHKMAPIRRVLYGPSRETDMSLKRLHDFALKMREELSTWAYRLPDSLYVSLSDMETRYLPHVLQLRMQFHATRVIVDRPFLSLPPTAMGGITAVEIEQSQTSCNEAAAAIARLLQIFRRQYGLRRMNIHTVHLIFTASLVHVHSACLSPSDETRSAARRHLEVCCQALAEVGQAYKNALRALEVITSIKSNLLRSLEVPSGASLNSAAASGRCWPTTTTHTNNANNPTTTTFPSPSPAGGGQQRHFQAGPGPGPQPDPREFEDFDIIGGSLDIMGEPAPLAGQTMFSAQWPWAPVSSMLNAVEQ